MSVIRGLLTAAAACVLLAACGSAPEAIDRTDGVALELLWVSADKGQAMYFEVDRDGDFSSGGGVSARLKQTDYAIALADGEISEFVRLTRAVVEAQRAAAGAGSAEGDDEFDCTVREGDERTRFRRVGSDRDMDALLAFLRTLSLRRFRDVIDAQPVAGERFGS